MDDQSKIGSAKKGGTRDAQETTTTTGSRDKPWGGGNTAKAKPAVCKESDVYADILANIPKLMISAASAPRSAGAKRAAAPGGRRERARTSTNTLKRFRYWIPQWDEQVIGRMAFESLGFHHKLSEPPAPAPLTDKRLENAFYECRECCLTWLTGFNRLNSGGPGTQCVHPWHYACGRDNEDLMAPEGMPKSQHRLPRSSIVVHISAVADYDGDRDGAFGVWFATGSPYNISELMPSSPPTPKTEDQAQPAGEAREPRPYNITAAAYKRQAGEIMAATRALELLERRILPNCKKMRDVYRRIPKVLSDLIQAADHVWARLEGVDPRLFVNEIREFRTISQQIANIDTESFLFAVDGSKGNTPIVGSVGGGVGRSIKPMPDVEALREYAAVAMPQLKDINKRLDDHHYSLMEECRRRTEDAARQMGVTGTTTPPTAWRLRKWEERKGEILNEYMRQMYRNMGPDAHKMQTHYAKIIDHAASSWVEPWLRSSRGGLLQAPVPLPHTVLGDRTGGGSANAAPKMTYDASSPVFFPKPKAAADSAAGPAATTTTTTNNPLSEALLKHNIAAPTAGEAPASGSAAGTAEGAAKEQGSAKIKRTAPEARDETADMRVIIVTDSPHLVQTACHDQEQWKFGLPPRGKKAKAEGIGSAVRDDKDKPVKNPAEWMRLWVAISRIQALAGVEVLWYAVPTKHNEGAIRLARSAMPGKGEKAEGKGKGKEEPM